MKGAQRLRNPPRLCEAAARRVGSIAVHDLADAPDAAFIQMVGKPFEQGDGMSGIAVDRVMRECKGPEEPAPDGSWW